MPLRPINDLPPLVLFQETATDLLAMLRERVGMRLWVVSRVQGDAWIASVVEGEGYGIRAGYRFDWDDTLCSKMVAETAPRLASDVRQVPAYACRFTNDFRIGAYLGVPISCPADKRLMGTLCAFDPAPQPHITPADLAMVETCARVLSRVGYADLRAAKQSRRIERSEGVALCDALTGLYNRRGWDQLLKAEESRCRRHGRSACVVSIDLDALKVVNDSGGHGKGDELLRRAADALRATIRTQDIAARVGGDEFAVLAVECDEQALLALTERVALGLEKAGVSASLGVAMRTPTIDLAQTWRQADDAMYRCKRERKSAGRVRAVSGASAR
jgi:diguanylate cyclase (GGDEF)-like protein